ncbi:unnamed protein product, partial [Ectocarpus sp. 12 AP-2014]
GGSCRGDVAVGGAPAAGCLPSDAVARGPLAAGAPAAAIFRGHPEGDQRGAPCCQGVGRRRFTVARGGATRANWHEGGHPAVRATSPVHHWPEPAAATSSRTLRVRSKPAAAESPTGSSPAS